MKTAFCHHGLSFAFRSANERGFRGAKGDYATVIVVVAALFLVSGCASGPTPTTNSFHDQRKKRDEDVARHFADKRDVAEFQAAQNRWEQQDYPACRDQLENLLTRNPNHREARLLLADVMLATDHAQDALAQLQQLGKANPGDPDIEYATGLTLDTMGRRAEALPYYERAAKAVPDNETYSESYRTARASADGSKPQSPPPVKTADATRPPSHEIDFVPGGSSAKSAAVSSDTASSPGVSSAPRLAPKPERAEPIASAGAVKPGTSGIPDTSVKPVTHLETVRDEPKDSKQSLLDRGIAALDDGSPKTAEVFFRQAIARNPDNPQIPITASTACLRSSEPKLAIELLEPASKQFPGSATIHRILGTAYYRTGDYAASKKSLEQSLFLDKSNALSYFLMACTLTKLGQNEEADAQFRQAQALDPRYAARR